MKKQVLVFLIGIVASFLELQGCYNKQNNLIEKVNKFEVDFKVTIDSLTDKLINDTRLDTNYTIEILPKYNNQIRGNYLDSNNKRGSFFKLEDSYFSKNEMDFFTRAKIGKLVCFAKEKEVYLTTFYFKKGNTTLLVYINKHKFKKQKTLRYNYKIFTIHENYTYYIVDAF